MTDNPSDCEYHDLSAEDILDMLYEQLVENGLLDVMDLCIPLDHEDWVSLAVVKAAMCRVEEIVKARRARAASEETN